MQMNTIIERKRDGQELTSEEINFFIKNYTDGVIPDYQASALLMAIYFRDMTDRERATLTQAMVDTGDIIDLADISGIKVDKHSTGGVGDTTTLILAPLVASVGAPVAKMSGRGLGHTGGTLDKLEAIPGFTVEQTDEAFIHQVNRDKVAVIGQTGNLAPADKKLYALRDVTATVSAIPLIASSIMSKKIASGSDAIVLDVKTGSGAFMKELDEAEALAEAMVTIGNDTGRQTMAVISDMSQPLGHAIGNSLEVQEAIETLKGQGPDDLTELCLTLGSQMVVLAECAETIEEARDMLNTSLHSGKALDTFKQLIRAQDGDPAIIDAPWNLPEAKYQIPFRARRSGKVEEMVANEIGTAAMMLGAGRTTKDSPVDLAVGIVLHHKVRGKVDEGDAIATIHANETGDLVAVKKKLDDAITITSDESKESPELIRKMITG